MLTYDMGVPWSARRAAALATRSKKIGVHIRVDREDTPASLDLLDPLQKWNAVDVLGGALAHRMQQRDAEAVTSIQASWRGRKARADRRGRQQRLDYRDSRISAARLIQSRHRGIKARQRVFSDPADTNILKNIRRAFNGSWKEVIIRTTDFSRDDGWSRSVSQFFTFCTRF